MSKSLLYVAPATTSPDIRDVTRGYAEPGRHCGWGFVRGPDFQNLSRREFQLPSALSICGRGRVLEMGRVDALSVRAIDASLAVFPAMAEMVETLTSRDRPNLPRPDNAVGQLVSEDAVAIVIDVPPPDPAARDRVRIVERLCRIGLETRTVTVEKSLMLSANRLLSLVGRLRYRCEFSASALAQPGWIRWNTDWFSAKVMPIDEPDVLSLDVPDPRVRLSRYRRGLPAAALAVSVGMLR